MTQAREQLAKKIGAKAFEVFVAIKYRTQVVAGLNYYIKVSSAVLIEFHHNLIAYLLSYIIQVRTGDDDYIHIRVFQDLKQDITLSGYLFNRKYVDPIIYFE